MYLLCIGASRGFAFVEFNATQEAARWMEMKQVERSSVQIPNRCVVARVPPTAPWRQGTVTQPSGLPRGHGCAPVKLTLSYLIIYLGIPHIFCRLFLNSRKLLSSLRNFSPRRVLLLVLCLKRYSSTNNEDREKGHSSRLTSFIVHCIRACGFISKS